MNIADGLKLEAKDFLSFLLLLTRTLHCHLNLFPLMKEYEDHLSAKDLLELLDVYPYIFLSEEHDRKLLEVFTQLEFVWWDRIDCFIDVVLTYEVMLNVKDGGRIMMLRRGEFACR